MENVMMVYLVLYMVLGLVIYHSIFEVWYFNFGKALLREIIGAFLFAALMTGITLKFWWIAVIVIVIVGLGIAAKVNNPTGKKIVVGAFVCGAIITAITGIKYNKEQKNPDVEEGNHSTQYSYNVENGTEVQTTVEIKNNSYDKKMENIETITTEEILADEGQNQSSGLGAIDYGRYIFKMNNEFNGWAEAEISSDNDIVKNICITCYSGGNHETAYFMGTLEGDSSGNIISSSPDTDCQLSISLSDDGFYLTVNNTSDTSEQEMEGFYTNMKSDCILPDSSNYKLSSNDISHLSLRDLNYAKNEIYARHGRKFKSSELNEYFNSKDWYIGNIDSEDFDEEVLSQIEKDNIRMLNDAEHEKDPNGYQLDVDYR